MSQKKLILVIDDNAMNIMVLTNTLIIDGFETIFAHSGVIGIQQAHKYQPDLIFLDIKMPMMDGYKVCAHLKADEQTRDIPIIFLSALSDDIAKIKAFAVGGVAYITQPFLIEEMLACVKTHFMLKQLQQANQEKNEFLGIAAHDLKNPLSSILGAVKLLEKLAQAENIRTAKVFEYANWIKGSAKQMFNIITNLLDVNAIDSGKIPLNLRQYNILPLLSQIVAEYTKKAQCKEITLNLTAANNEYFAYVDEDKVQQIFDNLVSNAVKYSPFGKMVNIRLFTTKNARVCCEIQDEGPGLSIEEQAKLFSKFSRLSPQPTNKEHSTGLGLFIVKKLVTAMGGKVWCESELGKGSKFVVEFLQV